MFIEMTESRSIKGKQRQRGEKLDVTEEVGGFLIARKEARAAKAPVEPKKEVKQEKEEKAPVDNIEKDVV